MGTEIRKTRKAIECSLCGKYWPKLPVSREECECGELLESDWCAERSIGGFYWIVRGDGAWEGPYDSPAQALAEVD